jgi:hypothetical protein
MLTLLGSALGLFTSFLPKVMDYFQNKQDNTHELAMLEKVHSNQMEMTAIDASIREVETIHEHDAALKGGKFIDGLRASVRPIITYLFMALFMAVEITSFVLVLKTAGTVNLETILSALQAAWGEENRALFATILSFWFGGRLFRKK